MSTHTVNLQTADALFNGFCFSFFNSKVIVNLLLFVECYLFTYLCGYLYLTWTTFKLIIDLCLIKHWRIFSWIHLKLVWMVADACWCPIPFLPPSGQIVKYPRFGSDINTPHTVWSAMFVCAFTRTAFVFCFKISNGINKEYLKIHLTINMVPLCLKQLIWIIP